MLRASPISVTELKHIYLYFRALHSLWAASSKASVLGNPIITPPSAIASRKMHANAGPEPARAVHASKCFSSRKRHRPMEENIFRIMALSVSSCGDGGRVDTTVMPSRIWWSLTDGVEIQRGYVHTLHGVLGMARTTLVEGKTQPVSWRMVTPARMLIRSFPSSASTIPSSLKILCASWGLQLKFFDWMAVSIFNTHRTRTREVQHQIDWQPGRFSRHKPQLWSLGHHYSRRLWRAFVPLTHVSHKQRSERALKDLVCLKA